MIRRWFKPKTEEDQDRLIFAILVTFTATCWFVFPTLAFYLARVLP